MKSTTSDPNPAALATRTRHDMVLSLSLALLGTLHLWYFVGSGQDTVEDALLSLVWLLGVFGVVLPLTLWKWAAQPTRVGTTTGAIVGAAHLAVALLVASWQTEQRARGGAILLGILFFLLCFGLGVVGGLAISAFRTPLAAPKWLPWVAVAAAPVVVLAGSMFVTSALLWLPMGLAAILLLGGIVGVFSAWRQSPRA